MRPEIIKLSLINGEYSYIPANTLMIERAGEKIIPVLIGHHYKPIRVHNMEELLSTYLNHKRMRVFVSKGLKCAYCEKSGIYLISAVDRFGSIHIDIYTKNFELMTVDHVYPKCKGGSDDLSNLVPACESCNRRKGSKLYPINHQ
jgi:D-alanyl-D-alanine carboxypeptidase